MSHFTILRVKLCSYLGAEICHANETFLGDFPTMCCALENETRVDFQKQEQKAKLLWQIPFRWWWWRGCKIALWKSWHSISSCIKCRACSLPLIWADAPVAVAAARGFQTFLISSCIRSLHSTSSLGLLDLHYVLWDRISIRHHQSLVF